MIRSPGIPLAQQIAEELIEADQFFANPWQILELLLLADRNRRSGISNLEERTIVAGLGSPASTRISTTKARQINPVRPDFVGPPRVTQWGTGLKVVG